MLTEDTPNNGCSKNVSKESKNDSLNISKLEIYINKKLDKVATNHLKENILAEVKQQFSSKTK